MQYPETLYEKQKRLEATISRDRKWFKLASIIGIVALSLIVPLALCWFVSKFR